MGTELTQISDEQLFIRYTNGDSGAFSILMDRYAIRLLHFCRSFIGSEEDAEDIVQETFLRAIKSARTYRSKSKFSKWIFTIARNLCLDRLKMERNRKDLIQGREMSLTEWTMGDLPAQPDENDTGLSLELISEAFNALSELESETIWLTFFANWTTKQIAELQDCSRTTVRTRRFRAIEKIRAVFPKELNDGEDYSSKEEHHA